MRRWSTPGKSKLLSISLVEGSGNFIDDMPSFFARAPCAESFYTMGIIEASESVDTGAYVKFSQSEILDRMKSGRYFVPNHFTSFHLALIPANILHGIAGLYFWKKKALHDQEMLVGLFLMQCIKAKAKRQCVYESMRPQIMKAI